MIQEKDFLQKPVIQSKILEIILPNNWKKSELKHLGKISSGGTPDTTNENFWNGNINWCTPTDITKLKGAKYIGETLVKITDEGLKNSSATLLTKGSLIVCTRATLGKAAIATEEISTNQGFKNIVPNKEKVDIEFLYYSIINAEQELQRLGSGSTFLEISKKDFEQFQIPLPPLPEQKAIAHVLGLMDTAININNQLLAQKEQRKKWLMQNLLTGKKRMKGFELLVGSHKTDLGLNIPTDWKIIKVRDIFKERKDTSKDQSTYPLFSLTIENGLTAKTDRYERSFLLKNKEENLYKLIYPNDILFNPMNLRFGAIAKSKIDKVVSVSAYYNSIYSNEINVDIDFYEALFKNPIFINLYDRIAIGSLIEKKRVHLSNFLELEIPQPNKNEQTAIAQVLQSADKELQILKTKTEKLKEQKKGMMQVLLTGKVRLKIN